jgi:NAD(P)-dependent dehydrogenase (short-subunit alcohol dehydrogenase family)
LITGVSEESIAGELAIQLAAANPKLLILCARAESKVAPIANKIKKSKPNVETRFLNMELGDLSNVRQAVEVGLADVPKIDHVVLVAGVMACPFARTKDGFEMQFGVNYLANFLLVKLLLPKVQAVGPTSSIIITSSAIMRQGTVHFDDLDFSVSLKQAFLTPMCFTLTASIGWKDLRSLGRIWPVQCCAHHVREKAR